VNDLQHRREQLRLSGKQMPQWEMQGFAPADESLLFRQKGPKPFLPVGGPTGPSASSPNKMVQELTEPALSPSKGSNSPNQKVDSAQKLRRTRRREDPLVFYMG